MGRSTVRTSVSIPGDLRERMNRIEGVNWSAIAGDAIETVVREREERSMHDIATDAVERLKRGESIRMPIEAVSVVLAHVRAKRLRARWCVISDTKGNATVCDVSRAGKGGEIKDHDIR